MDTRKTATECAVEACPELQVVLSDIDASANEIYSLSEDLLGRLEDPTTAPPSCAPVQYRETAQQNMDRISTAKSIRDTLLAARSKLERVRELL